MTDLWTAGDISREMGVHVETVRRHSKQRDFPKPDTSGRWRRWEKAAVRDFYRGRTFGGIYYNMTPAESAKHHPYSAKVIAKYHGIPTGIVHDRYAARTQDGKHTDVTLTVTVRMTIEEYADLQREAGHG